MSSFTLNGNASWLLCQNLNERIQKSKHQSISLPFACLLVWLCVCFSPRNLSYYVNRKGHGKIDFKSLARTVSKNWRNISEERKKACLEIVKKDKIRHAKEMREWKETKAYLEEQQRLLEPIPLDSSVPAPSYTVLDEPYPQDSMEGVLVLHRTNTAASPHGGVAPATAQPALIPVQDNNNNTSDLFPTTTADNASFNFDGNPMSFLQQSSLPNSMTSFATNRFSNTVSRPSSTTSSMGFPLPSVGANDTTSSHAPPGTTPYIPPAVASVLDSLPPDPSIQQVLEMANQLDPESRDFLLQAIFNGSSQ